MENLFTFTIIGFGNQARAWALNLRDSGVEVSIGLRGSSLSHTLVEAAGFKSFNFETEGILSNSFALLTPDHTHDKILTALSTNNKNLTCLYAHGFSMNKNIFAKKFPHFKHILLAPKSIASELRFRFETKKNLTAFYSLEFSGEESFEFTEQLANLLGINNLYPTTFAEETKADLFSEQTILCSLLPYGILESFNTLIENGYSKEIAFFECFYESKLILDTIFKIGPQDFFSLISPNALIGSQIGKDFLIDKQFKEKLSKVLKDIEDNSFEKLAEDTDHNQLREEVSTFWAKQKMTSTFQELREKL